MRTSKPLLIVLISVVLFVVTFGLLSPTPGWALVKCGDTIGPNEVAVLTQDLTCPAYNPALTLVGPGGILNLGGHTITCDTDSKVGIELKGEGSLLQHGTVTHCGVAVAVGGTGSHRILKVTATGNINGFPLVGGSNGNTLIYNRSSNNDVGFGLVGGGERTDENRFSWNISKGDGNPFAVEGNRNTFKYNVAENAAGSSFIVRGNDNTVTRNRANGGGIGNSFEIFGFRNTVIQNVAKNNNNGAGFFMLPGIGYQVIANKSKNNAVGIRLLEGAINSTIVGNIASRNRDFDLVDNNANCDHNQWLGNRFRTSNQGCIN